MNKALGLFLELLIMSSVGFWGFFTTLGYAVWFETRFVQIMFLGGLITWEILHFFERWFNQKPVEKD